MSGRRAAAPITIIALSTAALIGAAPANAESYCGKLHDQVQQDYSTYRQDQQKYGPKSPAAQHAYAAYKKAKARYEQQCG